MSVKTCHSVDNGQEALLPPPPPPPQAAAAAAGLLALQLLGEPRYSQGGIPQLNPQTAGHKVAAVPTADPCL